MWWPPDLAAEAQREFLSCLRLHSRQSQNGPWGSHPEQWLVRSPSFSHRGPDALRWPGRLLSSAPRLWTLQGASPRQHYRETSMPRGRGHITIRLSQQKPFLRHLAMDSGSENVPSIEAGWGWYSGKSTGPGRKQSWAEVQLPCCVTGSLSPGSGRVDTH